MNGKMRVLLTLILALLIILSVPKKIVKADPVNDFETEIQMLDNDISKSMRKIQDLNKNVEKTEFDIEKKKGEIIKAQEEMEKQEKLLGERLKAWYKSYGNNRLSQYVEILASTESLSDFFVRIDSINKMNKMDKKVAKELQSKKKVFEREEEELKLLKVKIEDDRKESKNELLTLEEKKKEVVKKLEAYKKEQERLRQEEIIKNNSQKGDKTPIDVPATGTVKDVIDLALSFRGVPYVWGGESPSGFDCSGLVQYCYGKYGYRLPRVSEDQQNAYKTVANDEIKPGDLVFWGRPAHHVGIYIGNGQYVHAPHTGDVVKVSSIYDRPITSAARVISN